jgi:hypothetical protein
VIAVMVVSDNSSALRCSFSPVSRDVCGEVVCEFEPPSWIVMLTARKQYDCRSKHPVRYKFPAITRPRQTPVNLRVDVDIHWSERRKMGTDLVNIVRSRSQVVLTALPSDISDLREKKGLVVRDVLKLLSLSEEGFRALKEGAGDAVKTLSRLQRFCQRRKIPDNLIPQFCELKTLLSAWWLKHADLIEKSDYTAFKFDCLELLKAHSGGTVSIGDLAGHAKDVAAKYTSIFNPLEVLTTEAVMGFIISLAVDAET